ncbi:hypothetical protein K439DRAFT_1634312 [Ramaria rubella]|nr:hypothetical protein K439DRAFT_1634312 [Ramaria rubella]
MRFLAIASVLFAVTRVAFAAPVFRASHLTPRTNNHENDRDPSAQTILTAHHDINNAAGRGGHPALSPSVHAPGVLTHVVTIMGPGQLHRTITSTDGSTHTIHQVNTLHPDGSLSITLDHQAKTPGKIQNTGTTDSHGNEISPGLGLVWTRL